MKSSIANTPATTSLPALLEGHLEYLSHRHYTSNTLKVRRIRLNMFLNWCSKRGLMDPLEVTRPVLEDYQSHLFHYQTKNGRHLSLSTQHARLASLCVWFRWMVRNNYLPHNPASELELPRLAFTLPNVLNACEAELVIQQPDITRHTGLRLTGRRNHRCCCDHARCYSTLGAR
jgi:integrase/recombinase XerD